MILLVFNAIFNTSISGYNSFNDFSKTLYFLTNFYQSNENSYYIKISKHDGSFALNHFNYTFKFKNYNLNFFDNLFYSPFSHIGGIYSRGIKIEAKNFTILAGKERNEENYIPRFYKNEYIIISELLKKNGNLNLRNQSILKKDRGEKLYYSNGFQALYQRENLNIDNKFSISFFNNKFGILDEFFYDYKKENRGFNFRFLTKTPLFYNTNLQRVSLNYSIYGRIWNRFNLKNFSLSTTYNLSYAENLKDKFFSNFLQFIIPIKNFPQISLSGGFDIYNKNLYLKRTFSLFYSRGIFEIRLEHLKSKEEINTLDFKAKLNFLMFNYYLIISNNTVRKYAIDYIKNNLSIGFYFTDEVNYIYKKNMGISEKFNFKYLNLNLSYFILFIKDKTYKNINFNISTPVNPIEKRLFTCEGIVFYDKNKNLIIDKEDEFIEGIEVILDGKEIRKTDKRGRFSFKFLEKGKHRLEIRYGALPSELGSATNEIFEFETGIFGRKIIIIPITEYAEVKGSVFFDENKNGIKDENERGIANCIISLNGFSTITDKNGIFHLNAIKPGTYSLKLIYAPYEYIFTPQEIKLTLSPGEKIENINIPLTKFEKKIKYYKF